MGTEVIRGVKGLVCIRGMLLENAWERKWKGKGDAAMLGRWGKGLKDEKGLVGGREISLTIRGIVAEYKG